MEETLKTVRFLHRTIVALCAVLLIFAFSPSVSDQYKKALNDLSDIQKIQPYQQSYEEHIDDSSKTKFYIFPFNLTKNILRLPDIVSHANDHCFFGKANMHIRERFEAPTTTSTIKVIWTSFDYEPNIWFQGPPLGDLSKIAQTPVLLFREEKAQANFSGTIGSRITVVHLTDDGKGFKGDARKLIFSNKESKETPVPLDITNREYMIDLFNRAELSEKEYDKLKSFVYEQPELGKLNLGYKQRTLLNIPSFRDWLVEELKKSHRSVPRSFLVTPMFPDLRRFWPEVCDKTIYEAKYHLEKRWLETQEKISFVGLSATETLISWLGPTALFVLLIYMLVHMKQIELNYDKHRELLMNYSWMSLYKFTLSEILTFLSLVVLPFLVTAALVIGKWEWKSPASYYVILISIGSLLCGLAIFHTCHRLRHALQTNKQDA
jgi:hypothetical protein